MEFDTSPEEEEEYTQNKDCSLDPVFLVDLKQKLRRLVTSDILAGFGELVNTQQNKITRTQLSVS